MLTKNRYCMQKLKNIYIQTSILKYICLAGETRWCAEENSILERNGGLWTTAPTMCTWCVCSTACLSANHFWCKSSFIRHSSSACCPSSSILPMNSYTDSSKASVFFSALMTITLLSMSNSGGVLMFIFTGLVLTLEETTVCRLLVQCSLQFTVWQKHASN